MIFARVWTSEGGGQPFAPKGIPALQPRVILTSLPLRYRCPRSQTRDPSSFPCQGTEDTRRIERAGPRKRDTAVFPREMSGLYLYSVRVRWGKTLHIGLRVIMRYGTDRLRVRVLEKTGEERCGALGTREDRVQDISIYKSPAGISSYERGIIFLSCSSSIRSLRVVCVRV
jgi:hypothetical protein